ncbi:MAG: TetR/AcrR family transcriptional regulator [Gemmatimonadota bacterium]|nr:TetR/AcrR family transcriptional regulator [Gemmatimonadota bacterium]
MSPGDAADRAGRILAAARTLGARAGVGALTLQAIAAEAGVSKALLLYHYQGKSALLDALVALLGEEGAARLEEASGAPRAMEAWRGLLSDASTRSDAALLNALALEREVDPAAVRRAEVAREQAATALAVAVLRDLGLEPRIPAPALGRILLRQLDGLAAATPHGEMPAPALEADLDTFALALIGLAR